ncbi:MAG: YwaF family protein [Clostridia bacterium]|nr:YwaF family protein [Clostridia bacterium]
MTFLYYAFAIISGVATFLLLSKFAKGENKGRLLKYIAIGLALIFAVRYLGNKVELTWTYALNINSPFGKSGGFETLVSTLAIWFSLTSTIILVTYPFFYDKVKTYRILLRYFATPVFAITLAMLPLITVAMDGVALANSLYFRDVILSIEVGISLAFSLHLALSNKEKFDWKSVRTAILLLLGMLAISMPSYTLQVIFGEGPTHLVIDDFEPAHRALLYGAVVLPVIIHLIFSRCDYELKRCALIFISVAGMISYSHIVDFGDLSQLRYWPLHLCNTAMYIVPLCLIFKMNKLYYFTLFINVFGAFLAMIMPNKDGAILTAEQVNFWVNHYIAFFMPILCISLRIFERPKLKQFIYSLIAFACYYVFVLIVNAYYGDTDFFFINSNFVAEKLGTWAEKLLQGNNVLTFTLFDRAITLYPIYQTLFFLAYVLLSFAMWFVYEQAFAFADLYADMGERKRKIKADAIALEIQMNGRSITEPMNLDGQNKLILRNFSKKYATSNVYAVKDANLEVVGGEIFGFLGPNGAGKSTIIKSIVGIQTITSGSIEVCGYDVEKQPVGAKMQLGFVPDHYALYENLTGREYVNYIADLYGVSVEDRTARIDEYVERFNLTLAFDNKIKTYSHGMKQKITIMSALVHEPKVWILDEPLTGLDPESIWQVKECMKAHAKKGNIVFFSSHIIDVVERICDRIAIIKKGNILCTRTIKEIEESGEKLENYYMDMIGEQRRDDSEYDKTNLEGAEG